MKTATTMLLKRLTFLTGFLSLGALAARAQSLPSTSAMTPKEEAEQLMNHGIPFARTMLSKYRELAPFAVAMTPSGAIRDLGAAASARRPTSRSVIDLLEEGLRQDVNNGAYKATAVFVDVRTQRPGERQKIDAVQVRLEHRDGYCVDVFFPYSLKGDSVEFGDVFASRRRGTVFDRCKE